MYISHIRPVQGTDPTEKPGNFVGPVPRTGRAELKTDIAKYFDRIDHDILLNPVEKKVKDKKALLKQQ